MVERPSPDILLSARDDQTQQLGFAAICGGIAVGTVACVAGLNGLESVLPDGWFGAWRDYTWPLPLGAVWKSNSAIYTPSSRCSYGDDVASMAWASKI